MIRHVHPWLLVAVIFGFAMRTMAQAPKEVDPAVLEIVERSGGWLKVRDPRKIARMSREDRSKLIRYFREIREKSKSETFFPDQYRTVLINLGDEEALDQLAQVLRDAPVTDVAFDRAVSRLVAARRPESIIRVAPIMFLDETYERILMEDSGPTMPKSFGIAQCILRIIEACPDFTMEVRDWAKQLSSVEPQLRRATMRKWWKVNERAFANADFTQVRVWKEN